LKLLIVDDQVSLHRYLDKVMDWEELGLTSVEHAYDGEEAATMVEQLHPDLMIMDIHMPLLNGIQSLERMQGLQKIPQTIILSAYDEFEYARDALRLKASQYLLKPVDAQLLKKSLSDLIETSILAARQAILSEINRTVYSGQIDSASIMNVQKAFEILSIDRYAILTFEDSLHSEMDYSCLMQGQTDINNHCILCTRHRNGQIVFVGGGEDLTDERLRQITEIVMDHMATSTESLSFGMSSIAQDTAYLPQLITESTQALRSPASGTRFKLRDAVRRIKTYVENEYQEDLTLQTVADRFDIDKYQLSRAFKQEFDINYWAYVTQVRMNKAAELLISTSLRNIQIAEHTGFLGESHFSRVFKKYYGATPKEYRETYTRPI